MDFGIALPTAADSWKVTKEAEELGFTHAWFYDTQMLSADCFVAMGAAAVNTKRIRLGTGVLVPSNRIAPVAANALATLNQLAPGRIDFGVGKVENGIKEVEAMRDAWSKAGHAMGDLQATAFSLGCVLKDGEPADSERAMAQAGPRAAVMLHRAVDEALGGLAPGVTMVSRTMPEMQGYIDLARDFEPKDAPYLQNHRGHLTFVKPEEQPTGS